MKRISVIIMATCFISAFCAAQSSPIVKSFKVDGENFYEVGGCAPGSSVAFYSVVGGGRMLRSMKVTTSGKVTAIGNKDFTPAMVLNNGRGGSKMVSYFGASEFSLNCTSIKAVGKTIVINWNGAAESDDISFAVLRSTDGINYQTVGSELASPGNTLSLHQYSETWDGNHILYKVAVISRTSGLRFETKPMSLSGFSAIAAFPTSISDNLYISLPSVAEKSNYSIVNSDGRKVLEGSLLSLQTELSVSHLPAGNYIVTIRSGAEKRVVRVVKI